MQNKLHCQLSPVSIFLLLKNISIQLESKT
jgi:hypothetical protein